MGLFLDFNGERYLIRSIVIVSMVSERVVLETIGPFGGVSIKEDWNPTCRYHSVVSETSLDQKRCGLG